MEIPTYQYRGTPEAPTHATDVPMLPPFIGQGLAKALVAGGRALESATGAEGDLEASRVAVRAAQFRLGVDQMAAEAQENPNLDLSPEQAQQQFVAGAMQRTQEFAKTIRNERLRNQFLAQEMGRIGHHSINVRHATAKAWHDDVLAGSNEVETANLQRYQLAPTPEGRQAIAQEQFGLYDDLVQRRILTAKDAQRRKRHFLNQGEIGAVDQDMEIDPEGTQRKLMEQRVNERGEVEYANYPTLTPEQRRVKVNNARGLESQRREDAERHQKQLEKQIKEEQDSLQGDLISMVLQKRGEEVLKVLQTPGIERKLRPAQMTEVKHFLDGQTKDHDRPDDVNVKNDLVLKYIRGDLAGLQRGLLANADKLSFATKERFATNINTLKAQMRAAGAQERTIRHEQYADALKGLEQAFTTAGEILPSRKAELSSLKAIILDEYRVRARDSKTPQDPQKVKDELIIRLNEAVGREGRIASDKLIKSLPGKYSEAAALNPQIAAKQIQDDLASKRITPALAARYATVLRQIVEAQEAERKKFERRARQAPTRERR